MRGQLLTGMIGLLVGAAALVLGMGEASPAQAEHVRPGQYVGITSDFGDIEFLVNAAGTAVENVTYTPPSSPATTACPATAQLARASVENHAVSVAAQPGNAGQRNVGLTITFAPGGFASGSFTVDAPNATTCPNRQVTFTALTAAEPLVSPAPGATFTGTTSFGGTVAFTIGADGTTMQRLELTYRVGDCNYGLETTASIANALGAERTFDLYIATPGNPADRADVIGGFTGSGVGTGVIVAGTSDAGCLPVLGTFSVRAQNAGRLTTGAIPTSGGFGLVVFGGGSNGELLAASGCPRATAAFWATDAQGAFVPFVPASTVAVVNESWNAMFPYGIPAGTPLIGKCV